MPNQPLARARASPRLEPAGPGRAPARKVKPQKCCHTQLRRQQLPALLIVVASEWEFPFAFGAASFRRRWPAKRTGRLLGATFRPAHSGAAPADRPRRTANSWP